MSTIRISDEILEDEDLESRNPTTKSGTPIDLDEPASDTEILILGSVEARGWRSPPERAVVVELACYLALHRERPVSGESLRAALRPDGSKEQSAKTLRTYLSMLRKALGPDALPSRPSGGYQLASWITTDWERFVELSRSDDVEDALEALSLIRGRPFEGVPRGTYAWVFSEFLVSDMEVAIASVVTRAVGTLVKADDLERALGAVRQGLRAVTGDYGLWELYLSIAAQVSPAALSRARSEARAALGEDAPAGLIHWESGCHFGTPGRVRSLSTGSAEYDAGSATICARTTGYAQPCACQRRTGSACSPGPLGPPGRSEGGAETGVPPTPSA